MTLTPEEIQKALVTRAKLECVIEDLFEDLRPKHKTNELCYIFAALLGRVHADCKDDIQRALFSLLSQEIFTTALNNRLEGLRK